MTAGQSVVHFFHRNSSPLSLLVGDGLGFERYGPKRHENDCQPFLAITCSGICQTPQVTVALSGALSRPAPAEPHISIPKIENGAVDCRRVRNSGDPPAVSGLEVRQGSLLNQGLRSSIEQATATSLVPRSAWTCRTGATSARRPGERGSHGLARSATQRVRSAGRYATLGIQIERTLSEERIRTNR